MRSRLGRVAVVIMLLALLASIGLNVFLFRQGQWYYRQLNAVRLDPLSLDAYPTALDPQQNADHGTTTVVLFGDSRAANWPAPDLPGFEFVQRGIGNETSSQAMLRFDHHVRPLAPEIVVLQVGINDLKAIPLFPEWQEAIVENCQANIRQIVAWCREMGATVIVTTLFPLGEVPIERRLFWSADVARAVEAVNDDIRSLEGEGVYLFDAYATLADEDGQTRPEFQVDLLHLNATGYERLNEAISGLLTRTR